MFLNCPVQMEKNKPIRGHIPSTKKERKRKNETSSQIRSNKVCFYQLRLKICSNM